MSVQKILDVTKIEQEVIEKCRRI